MWLLRILLFIGEGLEALIEVGIVVLLFFAVIAGTFTLFVLSDFLYLPGTLPEIIEFVKKKWR